MSTSCVVIPTYGELINLRALLPLIWESAPDIHVFIVDDYSGDGTPEFIRSLNEFGSRLFLLSRAVKEGLAHAYQEGLAEVLARGYGQIVIMDADLSHDPVAIPQFLRELEHADMVVGSRYINGIRVMNWDMGRLLLSVCASYYVRGLIGMPFCDPTGGFRAFRAASFDLIPFRKMRVHGYGFQVEILFWAWIQGLQIAEVPIVFTERSNGRSKMDWRIIVEALFHVVWLGLLKIQMGFCRFIGISLKSRCALS